MVDKSSQQVRRMFASVAHRYDFLNRLLSLSIDRLWRSFTRKRLGSRLGPGKHRILDLCTGTGDLALELSRIAEVTGCDFCHPMLVRGRIKAEEKDSPHSVLFCEGDALQLPFAGRTFEAVSIAFGLRNLEDYAQGLTEMARVLKPGGYLAVLEFSIPRWPVFRQLYLFYFTRVLPRIGRLVSGKEGPYSYLPDSVRDFPSPEALIQLLGKVGFDNPEHFPLTGGIASLYLAEKREFRSAHTRTPSKQV